MMINVPCVDIFDKWIVYPKVSTSRIFMFREKMVKIVNQLFQVLIYNVQQLFIVTSTLFKYLFKIGNTIVSSFCSRLSQSACFSLKASQYEDNPAKALQRSITLVKRPNISAKYVSLHNHTSSNKIVLLGSSFLSKSVYFFTEARKISSS